jgi:PhnB protein
MRWWQAATYLMTFVARVGFRVVTPRIVTTDVAGQVSFLRRVFDAGGEYCEGRPSEIRIGDSSILVSEAGVREPFPAFLYVYVDVADKVFARAVAAGATVLEQPLDTPYGDRRAMVRDPYGNIWQIAHVNH